MKLCGTNTNDASFMKGFSMQGTAGDLINNENVFSIAMCYSTATLDDVKAFFTSERFSDPDSFLQRSMRWISTAISATSPSIR